MSPELPASWSTFAPAVRDAAEGFAVAAYALCQAGLVLYSSHRWSLVFRRAAHPHPAPPVPAQALPCVTVQLPVYNEPRVVERLIEAAARLDYPPERLEIQVLDDSTDETSECAARAVARLRAAGVDIRHLRRDRRDGFKAGALAAGMTVARGELLAVFDADFVPSPDFLARMVPHFADPGVGLVQARWGHLNRDRSALTRAQAVMLDAHFLLEHAARMSRGLFFNFNGTAGVWRRACVEAAGGWSHDTLTEDLDLSYRAQLAGWRFVFDPEVVVPAELPGHMQAFKSQQRRWAKGSIQTARKLLREVWRRPLPLAVKVEAFFHLTSNLAYPLLVALSALLLPVLLGRALLPPVMVWALQIGVLVLGIVPVTLFLAGGQRARGASWRELPIDVGAALVLGIGLSINNARAVLEGFGRASGEWERTPKTGETSVRPPPGAHGLTTRSGARAFAGRTELALAGYFGVLLIWAAHGDHLRAVPFLGLLALGFAWVGAGSLAGSETARR